MMYKRTVAIVVSVVIVSSLYAVSHKIKAEDRDQDYTEVIIMEKGVKRKILIPKERVAESRKSSYDIDKTAVKEGVLIMFEDPETVDIERFERQYGLKLITKMRIGYFVFKNVSKYSDIDIISKIISNETHIVTIKPNWKMDKKSR